MPNIVSKSPTTNWNNDLIQFARFIEEAQAAGAFTPEVLQAMRDSMDLKPGEPEMIMERARVFWEFIKTGSCQLPTTEVVVDGEECTHPIRVKIGPCAWGVGLEVFDEKHYRDPNFEMGPVEGPQIVWDWFNNNLQALIYDIGADPEHDEPAATIQFNSTGGVQLIEVRRGLYTLTREEGCASSLPEHKTD